MCNLKKLSDDVYVADIKYDYILNIIEQAKKCKGIDKIVLFGSSIDSRCNEESDIDIAVYGHKSKSSYLKTKEFKDFHRNLFLYKSDDAQDYDILYFVSGKNYDDAIMKDISNGTTIYRRAAI